MCLAIVILNLIESILYQIIQVKTDAYDQFFFKTVFNNFFPGRDIGEILFGGHSSQKRKFCTRPEF